MKKIITSLVVIAIIIIGFMYFKNTKDTNNSALNQETTQDQTQNEVSSIPQNSTSTISETTLKPIKMTEVTKHNKPEDCWTAINGKVYDLTAFASKHPGGDKAIFSICGIDGSKAFNGQHGGQENPKMALEGFDIGILAQ